MKAIRVHRTGPPEVMQLQEMETPRPGRGQLLVRIHAAGVNPVDTYVRAGAFGYAPQVPYTPGADGAGVVEAVGPDVQRISVGQRVYGGRCVTGSYAEYGLFEEGQIYPLPQNVSFAQGACLGIPYGTACRALFTKAQAQPGETVLVHGASGGVGLAAVQLAKEAKLTIIGTAGSDKGRERVRQQGADRVLDHSDPGHFDQVMKFTGGRGVAVILEMLANRNLGYDLKILSPFGRVVVVGSRGTVEIDPRDAMQRDAAILGMVLKSASLEESREIHRRIIAGLESGTLQPVLGGELPLAQAAEAHRRVMTPPANGNIVLIC